MLMDLLRAFDCIPHDLLIAKLSAYGLNGNALKNIYTYLKNCKQCDHVYNVCSDFKDIISVKLLIHIDEKLRFNLHISNICKSASKQLNTLVKLKCFLGFEERKILIKRSTVNVSNYRHRECFQLSAP